MKVIYSTMSVLFLLCVGINSAVAKPSVDASSASRVIFFDYHVDIPAVSPGEGPINIFLPLAVSDEHQEVLKREIKTSIKGEIKQEKTYGNTFWTAKIDHTDGKVLPITVSYEVRRSVFQQKELELLGGLLLSNEELEQNALYLKANKRVPVKGSLIEKVQKDLPKTDSNAPSVRSRAIYDYVVDNMEYKKVGSGWGNGDTYWACNEKYGNCTDFHALYTSLARAEKIPARFEIGFPFPSDRAEGKIGGYHCWVTTLLPKVGWTPIDASEAKKHPEKRELFYGTHPADRIKFTQGRDLELGEGHTSGPLNYFIYPHVEIAGKAVPKVPTEFSFRS
jgi:hypothetical protein